MKKLVAVIVLLTLVVFTSCNNKTDLSKKSRKTIISKTDSQENYVSEYGGNYGETDDSIFYLSDECVYVIDKKSKKCIPFCNKPNCPHNDENCMSKYFGGEHLLCNNNRVYTNSSEWNYEDGVLSEVVSSIYSFASDEDDKKAVFRTKDLFINNFKVHRGYLYITAGKWDNYKFETNDNVDLYRVPIDGGKLKKLSIPEFHSDLPYSEVCDYKFFGNYMYISLAYSNESGEKGYVDIFRYDLDTMSREKVSEKLTVPMKNRFFTALNEKLFYISDSVVYSCDLDGSNNEEFLDCKTIAPGFKYYTLKGSDGENLVIDCTQLDFMGEGAVMRQDENYAKSTLLLCDYEGSSKSHIIKDRLFLDVPGNKDCMISVSPESDELFYIDKTDFNKEDISKKIYNFPNN